MLRRIAVLTLGTMYIWHLTQLKADLKTRALSEAEIFPYICLNTVIYGLAFIPIPGITTFNGWDTWSGVVSAVLTFLGMYYIYTKNGGAAGSNFVQNYFALGFVFGVRWCVLVALPLILVFYIGWGVFGTLPAATTVHSVVFFNVLIAHYFWKLGEEIEDIR